MRSESTQEVSKKGEIGRRIRAVRGERGLTLRQVASMARLSATHISEIERGHTTPTVGALVRIADALGREPHFFLEPEWLPDVSLMRREQMAATTPLGAREQACIPLTKGIPGGRLLCSRLLLPPHSRSGGSSSPHGEIGGYVVRGRIEVTWEGERLALGPGDGFHLRADVPHEIRNPGEETAEVLWITTQPAVPSR